MVLLIIIPIKWLFVWEYTLFSDKPNNHPGGDEELMCLGQLDHQAMGSRLGRTPGLLCQPTLTHLGEKTCGKIHRLIIKPC
jgi:hypothetical protein